MIRVRSTGDGGQALVETAILVPLLLLLFLGVYAASELISVQNAATAASRNAARIGAELGNNNYQPGVSSNDPTSIDQQIVAAATAALTSQTLSGARITEIDVYQPMAGQPPGYFSLSDASMMIDRYGISGAPVSGWPYRYLLSDRVQLPNREQQIGVRVVFTFSASGSMTAMFGGPYAAYSVFTFPPQ